MHNMDQPMLLDEHAVKYASVQLDKIHDIQRVLLLMVYCSTHVRQSVLCTEIGLLVKTLTQETRCFPHLING